MNLPLPRKLKKAVTAQVCGRPTWRQRRQALRWLRWLAREFARQEDARRALAC